jgi:Nuclear cap-binding protein subunit 3
MASSLSQLSASVTRILSLTGFPKELKTRDIQLAFSEWENANGGFKIKWIDDTSLLVVFADATVGTPSFSSGPLFFLGPLLSPALTGTVRI